MGLVKIDDYLHSEYKKKAKADGRTLEWLLNDRLAKGIDSAPRGASVEQNLHHMASQLPPTEPTYEPFKGIA